MVLSQDELTLQANLGGSPTQLDWIKAFLRVKEKDRGPLDFDAPGGGDTTWQRVYMCLRSGYDTEAIEVLIITAAITAPTWLTTFLAQAQPTQALQPGACKQGDSTTLPSEDVIMHSIDNEVLP